MTKLHLRLRQIPDNRGSDNRISKPTVFMVYCTKLAEARAVYQRMAVLLADNELERTYNEVIVT